MGESGGVVAPGRSTPPAESFIAANLSPATVLTPSVPRSAAAAGPVAALGRGLPPDAPRARPPTVAPAAGPFKVRGAGVTVQDSTRCISTGAGGVVECPAGTQSVTPA